MPTTNGTGGPDPQRDLDNQEIVLVLNDILQALQKILNHQRVITGLEQDQGDEY